MKIRYNYGNSFQKYSRSALRDAFLAKEVIF